MYHYKTSAIFATPIPSLDSECILAAYKKNFEYLVGKGYKPKINIMDNQATKAIKLYLTPQECKLRLAEPAITASMPLSVPFRPSRIISLGLSEPLTWTSPFNFGTRWPLKFRMQLISYAAPVSTPTDQHMSPLRIHTIGIGTPWRP